MRKFDIFKTVQLVVLVLLAGTGLYLVLTDRDLYQMIATDSHIRMLCLLLWGVCGVSFVFLFLDLTWHSSFKKEYRQMDYVASSDPISGIPNRYSCDEMIEKYMDKPLPPQICSIMLELTNLQEANRLHGRRAGNIVIRDFAGILSVASENMGFVGRNGGNRFLAILEDCSQEKLQTFLGRIEDRVHNYNGSADTSQLPIHFRYGVAMNEGEDIETITELIALSNRRITEEGGI